MIVRKLYALLGNGSVNFDASDEADNDTFRILINYLLN
jgi:hypothetical protein